MPKRKHKILPPVSASDPGSALSRDPGHIGDVLHSAAIHLLRRLRVSDLASGVGPAQLSALSVLVFAGPRSLSELAGAEQVSLPTMSRIVASLEQSGLVIRKATDDKRRFRLQPTAKGTRILQEGRRRRVEVLATALQSLTSAELEQAAHLAEFMRTLVRKL